MIRLHGAGTATTGACLAAAVALLVAVAIATAVTLAGCGRDRDPRRPPVILVSIDTCRADHIGCYGGPASATPVIDRLAAKALRFTSVIASVPMTLPSHCTMLTGTTPLEHGVHDNLAYRLDASRVTLAETLRDHGYQTAAVVGSFVLDSRFGLDQGFQSYDDRIETGRGGASDVSERKADDVTRRALNWLDSAPREGFFLFVHYFDPHAPYEPPEPFATAFAGDPYTGEIAYVDRGIGQILDKLAALRLYDRSLIIVTGDHGEGLGEHGESGHGYFIYQSTLSVPLIIKPPGRAQARVVEDRAGLIDIAPTVLGELGIAPAAPLSGCDLLHATRGATASGSAGSAERAIYCESLTPTKHGCAPLLGLVRGDLKYIQTSRPELYDLSRDPREARDLTGERARQANGLQGELEALLAHAGSKSDSASRVAPDEEMRARLQSLGYIAGRAVAEEFEFDASRPDPKDRIRYHEQFEQVLDRMRTRHYDEAERLCRAMLAEQGDAPAVIILLGDIAYETGRLDEAVRRYEEFLAAARPDPGASAAQVEAERLSPDIARAHYDLANALAALGRGDEALTHYRDALAVNPDHLEARYNLAITLAESGRVDEAAGELEQLLARQPDFVQAYLDLAEARRVQGRAGEAVTLLEQAVRIRPDFAPAHVRLARALMQVGREEEARRVMDEALRAFPELRRGAESP
jgi:arylsulfatase A-like enzyme/Flp pilus assembly protein TadD